MDNFFRKALVLFFCLLVLGVNAGKSPFDSSSQDVQESEYHVELSGTAIALIIGSVVVIASIIAVICCCCCPCVAACFPCLATCGLCCADVGGYAPV